MDALILTCSPRKGGNGDAAALLLQQGAAASGLVAPILSLRDYVVHPCQGCGLCRENPGHCAFDGQDDTAAIFARLADASTLMLTLPVYFYGPPALLKGFVDRAQAFWRQSSGGEARSKGHEHQLRPAYAVLTAARMQGPRLFEASLLILRCFFRTVGFSLRPPLLLRGLDDPKDLSRHHEWETLVYTMGRQAGLVAGM